MVNLNLELNLPLVEPEEFVVPTVCPKQDCCHPYVYLHQVVTKRLRDPLVSEVKAHRYRCYRCRKTFRVYPTGVNRQQISYLVKALILLLYLLNIGNARIATMLADLGVGVSKSQRYTIIQVATQRITDLSNSQFLQNADSDLIHQVVSHQQQTASEKDNSLALYATPAIPPDVNANKISSVALTATTISVSCSDGEGRKVPIGITIDASNGLILTIDELDRTTTQDAATLKQWLLHIANAVGAKVIISPAIETSATETALEQIAQDLGIEHKVCSGHAIPHFLKVAQSLDAEIMIALGDKAEISEGELETIIPILPPDTTEKVSNLTSYDNQSQQEDDTAIPQALIADLDSLQVLLKNPILSIGQQSEESKQQKHALEELHHRQLAALPPCKGEKATFSYRFRMLLLRLCSVWPLLTNCGCQRCQHLLSDHNNNHECENGCCQCQPEQECFTTINLIQDANEPFMAASNETKLAGLSNILAESLSTLLDKGFKDWIKECCRRMRSKGRIATILRILRLAAWFNNQILQSVSLTGRTLTGTTQQQNEQTGAANAQKKLIDWCAILN
jgi:transposase-like protein